MTDPSPSAAASADLLPREPLPPDPAQAIERAIEVKTYDIDFAGIVSNIVYIRWLEDLRLALMGEAYPLDRALAEGVAPLLLGTRIEYRRPIRITDRPVGRMWVAGLGPARWRVAAVFVVASEVAAAASQTGTFINLATRRPVPMPAPVRARFPGGA